MGAVTILPMAVSVMQGSAIDVLRRLPSGRIHTCVTSPPYYGLRDYGADGQIGRETPPEEFVGKLVEVFREVRRVLRDDGTLWVNIGDSYVANGGGGQGYQGRLRDKRDRGPFASKRVAGLENKQLLGIPWRLAFALQADGWILRQEIIWSKPNQMPESVRDRPTRAHEQIFLLSKSQRYYYDAEAVKEPVVSTKGNSKSFRGGGSYTDHNSFNNHALKLRDSAGNAPNATGLRNRRSVWTVTPKPFHGAHFATMPSDLVEPCVLAGAPAGGIVLDPFWGAGTTGLVAHKLGRKALGIEINPDYVELSRDRLLKAFPVPEAA